MPAILQEFLDVLAALFRPEVLLPVGVIAVTTIFRTILGIWKPNYEKSNFYKTLLHVMQPVLGIIFACVVKGVGMFADMKWGYMILIGIVAGWASTWIWILFKIVAKKVLKISETDIDDRISKTLVPKAPEPEKPGNDSAGDDKDDDDDLVT